ncbi:hypothetical protein F0562_017713 [Nyssa sinensis]|uniref:Uncharacterized protein n=1 Tax=Nyssa sinensis TaxID=561372 RepID=A0A5J4ZFW8_9ASTE|nr:hypothetical protein F0562_017713 [Nyssa sinensis]
MEKLMSVLRLEMLKSKTANPRRPLPKYMASHSALRPYGDFGDVKRNWPKTIEVRRDYVGPEISEMETMDFIALQVFAPESSINNGSGLQSVL